MNLFNLVLGFIVGFMAGYLIYPVRERAVYTVGLAIGWTAVKIYLILCSLFRLCVWLLELLWELSIAGFHGGVWLISSVVRALFRGVRWIWNLLVTAIFGLFRGRWLRRLISRIDDWLNDNIGPGQLFGTLLGIGGKFLLATLLSLIIVITQGWHAEEFARLLAVFLFLIFFAGILWRHLGKTVLAGLILALILGGLRWFLVRNDECREYLDDPSHEFRQTMHKVLVQCLPNDRAVRLAETQALDAARIERDLTNWYDSDPLVEFLGQWTPWVTTFGSFQVSSLTAQETYRRYRHVEALNSFLGIAPGERDELAKTSNKAKLVARLQLRCRGSILLGTLYVWDLWSGLDTGTMALDDEIVEQTRVALVRGRPGRPFFEVTSHGTEEKVERARQWLREALAMRLPRRLGMYVMAAYAGGLPGGRDANMQACLNEARLVNGRGEPLMPVDGDWGHDTSQAVAEYLGKTSAEVAAKKDKSLRAVRDKWEADVEQRLQSLLVGVIVSGDPGPLLPVLKNRYAGHVAVYLALQGMLECEATWPSEEIHKAAYKEVAEAWSGWTGERDDRLWRFLTDEAYFQSVFKTWKTGLYRQGLVRMAAQWFLVTRLVPRQLGFEVKMVYRKTWKHHQNLLVRIHQYAERHNMLLDVPGENKEQE